MININEAVHTIALQLGPSLLLLLFLTYLDRK
jgi:hypothetical protein